MKWGLSIHSILVRRGNQAQQENFRSFSQSSEAPFRHVQPLHSFHSNGTLRRALCAPQISLCPLLPLPFRRGVRGLLRAAATVLPMQAEHPLLSLCSGSVQGQDAVSLPRDNGGPGSCLWHNKGTSLLLAAVYFGVVSVQAGST